MRISTENLAIIIIIRSLFLSWCISDNDINGEAFMDLEDSDLVEMGFTKGQRMKIVKIIQSIKVRKSIESMDEFYGTKLCREAK